jgi:hypothetical protein
MLPGDKALPYKQLTGFRTWDDDTDPVEPDRDYSD